MDLGLHGAITGRLEQGKSLGWLSDYLVAWHGPSGQLSPNVTVWRAPGITDDELMNYLSGLLTGFVSPRAIEVESAADRSS